MTGAPKKASSVRAAVWPWQVPALRASSLATCLLALCAMLGTAGIGIGPAPSSRAGEASAARSERDSAVRRGDPDTPSAESDEGVGDVAAARAALDRARAELTGVGAHQYVHRYDVRAVLPADARVAMEVVRAGRLLDAAREHLRGARDRAVEDLAAAEEAERVAVAEYLAALAAQATRRATEAREGSTAACGTDFGCFKECTLTIESHGDYAAVSPGGTYRGAWQFDQRTWDSNAAASGRDDLVGVDPATVAPDDQDLVARALWAARGNAPWGGRC